MAKPARQLSLIQVTELTNPRGLHKELQIAHTGAVEHLRLARSLRRTTGPNQHFRAVDGIAQMHSRNALILALRHYTIEGAQPLTKAAFRDIAAFARKHWHPKVGGARRALAQEVLRIATAERLRLEPALLDLLRIAHKSRKRP